PLPDVPVFRDTPTADRDGDGVVATDELRWFADLTLPRLASHFPELVQRAGAPPRTGTVRDQAVRVQGAVAAFELVALPTRTGPYAVRLFPEMRPDRGFDFGAGGGPDDSTAGPETTNGTPR